ncbi:MAG: methyltransferase domain-containing protein [Vicinamibacterales bacterium]
MSRDSLEDTLRRLREERDQSDRRYNDALTQLDRAMTAPPQLPDAALALDDRQLGPLNETWNILPAPPASSWSRRKITGVIWAVVGPYLQRQLTFNSLLVDHANRNAEALRAAHRREQELVVSLRAQVDQITAFQARLMILLQQVTAYVDTRDRESAAGALILNAAISGLAEAQAKYRESGAAREYRYDARTSAVTAAHEELRGMLGIAQQAIVSLKRELQKRHMPDTSGTPGTAETPAFTPPLDAYKYVSFEDQFRGSRDVIRERLASYVPYFEDGAGGEVLDVGCGRGEFLDLLAARGIAARGIDLNHEMAEGCRARGLNVAEEDAVRYLTGLPDDSLGGLFAAQVVEHLEPSYLLRFLDLTFEKLQPGGRLVLETLNPSCWTAFFESYIRDITHRWPLHPDTLKYLVTASGFTRADVEFRSPVPPQDRLQPIAAASDAAADLADLVDTFNGNVAKLNARMFTHMDYAIIARKSSASR